MLLLWDLPNFLERKLGICPQKKPLLAVATHVHFDHAGGMHQFDNVAIHEAEADALARINADIAATEDDPARAAAYNQKFHEAIYMAARNRFLLDAARAMNNALLLLGPTTLADADRIAVVVAQHSLL